MLRYAAVFSLLPFLFLSAFTQNKSTVSVKSGASPVENSADASGRLPVKRVVLYKNGVGYFEHTARVHGTQDLNIDFTTSQLNDVLKSLTVVDMGEGRISSVRYNSIAPLAERLKSLRLPFGEQVTRTEFLYAMRGARVEVRSGTSSASGKLLSVESIRKQDAKGNFIDVTAISVITDAGEMRNFELGDGTSVRLAEKELNEEVGRYLSLISSSRARDVRRMTMTASGTGDRDVFVSYISEVPVWKSTYRIIFPEKEGDKPLLQGWAIVDNTIGEDWKDVQLSLVAGAPQSFIQDISQPFYARRPVIPLPQSAMLTPQSHEATMEQRQYDRLEMSKLQAAPPPPPPPPGVPGGSMGGVVGGTFYKSSGPSGSLEGSIVDPSGAVIPGVEIMVRNTQDGSSQSATSDSNGHYQLSGLTAGNYEITVQASGFHSYKARAYVGVGRTSEVNATLQVGATTEMVEVSAEKQGVDAEGKAIGDFFQYDVKQKISIARNQSALVPILQSRIDAEKVTLWTAHTDDDDPKPALRALWLKNTSGQVLDAGTFNVLDAGTFAGEGVLESVHPDERRLLSYAADTAVQVKEEEDSDDKPYSRIRMAKGLMVLTREQSQKITYKIHNADKTPRNVVIESPAQEGWDLTKETPKPEESSTSFHRFRVAVKPEGNSELVVTMVHSEEARYLLTNLNSQQLTLLTEQKRVTPAMQQFFDRILAQKSKISDLDTQLAQRKQETDQITADQNRIRENMKALKGSAEERALVQRYTKQLDSQEDRLAAIRKETEDLRAKRTEASNELDCIVLEVTMDESF